MALTQNLVLFQCFSKINIFLLKWGNFIQNLPNFMKLSIFFHQKMYFLNLKVIFLCIFLMTLFPFVIKLSFFVEKCQCQNQCFFKFPWKSTKFCKFSPSVPKQCFFKWFQCFFHSKIWSLWSEAWGRFQEVYKFHGRSTISIEVSKRSII